MKHISYLKCENTVAEVTLVFFFWWELDRRLCVIANCLNMVVSDEQQMKTTIKQAPRAHFSLMK